MLSRNSNNYLIGWILVVATCVLLTQSAVGQSIIYVDANAAGANNGSSWDDAYNYLQNGLAKAESGDEVWVAEGVYTPDKGGYYTPYKRERTFRLHNGVAIYGGFPSTGDPNLSDRDPNAYETILSGDLNGDDVGFVNNSENSYRVVTGSNCNETAILDGFIITGGNANGLPPYYAGGGMLIFQASPTLINCTFRVNEADCCGGGMQIERSSPTLVNCIFINNWANSGAAIYDSNSNPKLVECKFIENWGGAILNLGYSSPMIMDCLFEGNSASSGGALRDSSSNSTVINCTFNNNSASSGGALSYHYDSNSTLMNCTFKGNKAHSSGGAIYSLNCMLNIVNCSFVGNLAPRGGGAYNSSGDPNNKVMLTNCTFTGNEASDQGGGIYISRIALEATNCVFWGNLDRNGTDESAQIHFYDSAPVVTFSCIQDDDPNDMDIPFGGTDSNNIDEYPMFVREPDNGGDGWGIGSNDDFGDICLRCGSPCFNIGNNNSLPKDTADLDGDGNTTEWIPFDLDGDTRIIDADVDMGAYEGPTQAFIFDDTYVTVPEDGNTTFAVMLACEPNGFVDVNVAFLSGDEDITVQYGTTLVFDPNNFFEPDYVTLAAAEDIDFFDGTATIRVSAAGISDGYIRVTELDNDSPPNQPTLYVDNNAMGKNNGTSWCDAYTDLQWALFAAKESGGIVTEIRIAGGIYKPATPSGSRADTFELLNGVALYGGYAGCSGVDPNKRDIVIYETVLSGDLNGDDGPDFANGNDNSYHVVTGSGCNETTIIDGFTITAGVANGSSVYNDNKGGGMYNGSGYPTVTNCIFYKNSAASQGGGMYNSSYRGLISDCTFSENSAAQGGGIYNNFYPGPPNNFLVHKCTFFRNTAYEGGGIFNHQKYNVDIVLEGCKFVGNSANWGGGIKNNYSVVTLINCTFIGNCTGTTNRPYGGGAGLYNLNSTYKLRNCTLFRNNGGGISDSGGSANLINCILWHDSGREISISGSNPSTVTVSFSNIQGGREAVSTDPNCTVNWGAGNIDVEPNLTPDGYLIAGSPCIDVGTLTDAPDIDRDDESRPHGVSVDMGSDEFIDTDSDGLPDWWESRYFDSATAADPNSDADGDDLTNLQEYECYSSDPNVPPINVNPTTGPFWTIQEAIDAANDGDTVMVPMGTYKGSGNKDIDFGGKSIILYATSGAPSTIIDCEDSGRGFYFHSDECSTAAVVGFTIKNGQANNGGAIYCSFSSPQIKDCLITANTAIYSGGGIYCSRSKPTLTDCTISGNIASSSGGGICCSTFGPTLIRCIINGNNATSGGGVACVGGAMDASRFVDFADCILTDNVPDGIYISGYTARITGNVWLVSNNWIGNNIILTGDGILLIGSDSILDLDDSIIRCNISGTGIVQVALESELIIEADAVIDLAHETDPNLNGQILCDGLLRLRDNAFVIDAQVYVSRASFEDNAIMLNSVITAEAGAPYGQFFIEDNVQLQLDRIESDGDRYLDLDPTDFDVNNIRIGFIDVNITEGVGGTHGGLFELRGTPGLVNGTCDSNNVFFCKADPCTIPPFDPNNWTLNKLELVKDAKLNLTNRFDFQAPFDSGGDEEVLYVKHLILGPNSVLNTAFNHLYYETLIKDPTARIINIPLLGFSLVSINVNNKAEFLTRVKHNNFEHPENSAYDRIHVERIEGSNPDANGIMLMRSLIDYDPQSSRYEDVIEARAKGTFAKASEQNVTIKFEYMFIADPCNEAELIVYLSDKPELAQSYLEVARLRPPMMGRPGSIGSDSFAVFSGTFSRGQLNFVRGTYVELELRGTNAQCCVDNWDPTVHCTEICRDFDGYGFVNMTDYLILLAEFGLSSPSSIDRGCLDLIPDEVINTDDILAWDVAGILNLCPQASSTSVPDTLSLPTPDLWIQAVGEPEPLLIFGKPNTSGYNIPDNQRYSFDANGNFVNTVPNPENGRLVTDSTGKVYQVDSTHGLICLDTGEIVVEPNSDISYENSLVSVGVKDAFGLPLSDAVFDPYEPNTVYVVPVLVTPPQGEGCVYMAAAKLKWVGGGNYNLLMLYGKNPATDPDQSNTLGDCNNFKDFIYEPDVQHLHEIEIDLYRNLYVLSALWSNENNWVLIYNLAMSNAPEIRVSLNDPNYNDPSVMAPTAMLVSSSGNKVYLASSVDMQNDPNNLVSEVYRFSVVRDKQRAIGLAYDDSLVVNCPSPNTDICNVPGLPFGLCDLDKGNMSLITSIAENLKDDTLYVTGFTAPKFSDGYEFPSFTPPLSIFTTPMLAIIPSDIQGPVDANVTTNCNLALPLSIVWTGGISQDKCGGADIDNSGDVTFVDLYILVSQWLQPPDIPSADIDPQHGGDGIVNFRDFAILAEHWLGTGCNE